MFVHISNTQTIADQLKRIVEEQKPGPIRKRAIDHIQRLERTIWQPHTFEAEFNKIGTFTMQDGTINYNGDEPLTDVQRLIVCYIAQCDPTAVFGTEDAALYVGLSVPTMKHHIHVRGNLVGTLIGKMRVFTKAELDAFAASERRPGPKPKQKA